MLGELNIDIHGNICSVLISSGIHLGDGSIKNSNLKFPIKMMQWEAIYLFMFNFKIYSTL